MLRVESVSRLNRETRELVSWLRVEEEWLKMKYSHIFIRVGLGGTSKPGGLRECGCRQVA